MESIYQQWDKAYEVLTIVLCVLVLRYLHQVIDLRPAVLSSSSLKDLESLLAQIKKADIGCRALAVTIVEHPKTTNPRKIIRIENSDEE